MGLFDTAAFDILELGGAVMDTYLTGQRNG